MAGVTDPATIAKELSEAEAAALCGRWAWQSLEHAEEGEAKLFALGLWSATNLKARKKAITPLGKAVRAYLESSHEAE